MPMLALLPAIVLANAGPTLPGWMAGCWIEEKGTAWTEECWTVPRAGAMLGSGRSGKADRMASWEVMQIITGANGVPAFWGAPGGANRTAFTLVSQTAGEVVFANPWHDYPQRIRYWREGAALNAETSLTDGSKPLRWRYRRAG